MQFDFMNVGRGGVHAYADSCYYYFRTDQYADLNFLNQDSIQVRKKLIAKKVTFGMTYPFYDVVLLPADGPWRIDFIGEACGSYIELTPIGNDPEQLVKNVPEAIANVAFRPTFCGKLKFVNFMETICLFIFLAFGFWYNRRKRSLEERNIILFLLVFAVMLFILIGWTTPVLGAIVRYRMPAYLALFLAAFIGSRPFKFKL
jgi:hypothetical protein